MAERILCSQISLFRRRQKISGVVLSVVESPLTGKETIFSLMKIADNLIPFRCFSGC
jgi:hypothetical protein